MAVPFSYDFLVFDTDCKDARDTFLEMHESDCMFDRRSTICQSHSGVDLSIMF